MSPITTTTITTLEAFQQLQIAWNQMVVDPMNSFDWNFAWWKSFQSTGALHIIKFEQDGEIIGIAPFFVDRWYGVSRLRFIGSGKTCTDYVDLVCRPEHQDSLDDVLADYLRNSAIAVIELEGTRQERLALKLKSLLQDDFRSDHRVIEPTWVMDLPDSWDAFMKSVKSSMRRKLRKADKRLASGECELLSTADNLPLEEGFETFRDLHQLRFVSKGEPGVFSDQNFESFLKEVLPCLAEKGQAEIVLMKYHEQTIGAHFYLIAESGYQYYQSGYSPDHMKLEPGHLMFTAMVKRAILRGDRTYDFLRGNEPYKAMWGAKPSDLKKLRLISRRFIPSTVAACVNNARKLTERKRST